jgi:putative sterol carrier protein
MAASAREFFEGLPSQVDKSKIAGLEASYLFDVDGAGRWTVTVADGGVTVSEGGAEADCTFLTSEDTLLRIARGEQNPTAAYMTGRLKVKGDMGAALKLQKLF